MEYPLYDSLRTTALGEPNKVVDIPRLCGTINAICTKCSPADATEHYREIAALILHFYNVEVRSEPESKSKGRGKKERADKATLLPYNARTIGDGRGARYEASELPPLLHLIIAEYVARYSK